MAGPHLVTTALEDSWPSGRALLLLGEWCRRVDREERWGRPDVRTAEPCGLNAAERERNNAKVRRVAEALLPVIAGALNDFHGERHDLRYWRIVLGHWLLRYVSVIFNRYTVLATTLRAHQLEETTVLAADDYSLATPDSDSFVWATDDDLWNHVLYARVLRFLSVRGQAIDLQRVEWHRSAERGFTRAAGAPARRGVAARGAALATCVLSKLSRDRDAFLLSTYLPVEQRVWLELALGQAPQLWRSPVAASVLPNRAVREALLGLANPGDDVEQLATELWREVIPSCFVEGHAALVAQAKSVPWPRDPRLVFTSNAFDTDEVFKVWVGDKVEKGVPYVAGQHGNNYGTHVWWGARFWPDRAATDRFVTWGWSSDDGHDVPAFIFKTAGKASRTVHPRGGLLLIEVTMPHRISPYDSDAEFAAYQEQQFQFAKALPEALRLELTVRLHGEFRKHQWREDLRWARRDPAIRLEKGGASIQALVAASRLVVHSYDSTGILETLALDVPTMCFWQGGLDHLLPEARPYYELLRAAGILHDEPDAAADAVAERWPDVEAWWRSPPVRSARAEFCHRYARTVSDPVRTLKRVLLAPPASRGVP